MIRRSDHLTVGQQANLTSLKIFSLLLFLLIVLLPFLPSSTLTSNPPPPPFSSLSTQNLNLFVTLTSLGRSPDSDNAHLPQNHLQLRVWLDTQGDLNPFVREKSPYIR